MHFTTLFVLAAVAAKQAWTFPSQALEERTANIAAIDISSAQSESFYGCAAKSYKKIVIRGYSQACSSGGAVDPNFVPAAKAAKKAGFKEIEAYLFPCSAPTNGKACKSPATQIKEFEEAVQKAGLKPKHLWLDIEPTSSPCHGWDLAHSSNVKLAKEWVALIKKSKYAYGIYGNEGQWSGMFGSTGASIDATSLPLWAVQDDDKPGVSTTNRFFGGWKKAYGKQYHLDTTVCGGGVDVSSFLG